MINLIQGQVFSFEEQLYSYVGKFENAKEDNETWFEYINNSILKEKDKFILDDFHSLGIGDPFNIGKNDMLYFYRHSDSCNVLYVLDEYGRGVFVYKLKGGNENGF